MKKESIQWKTVFALRLYYNESLYNIPLFVCNAALGNEEYIDLEEVDHPVQVDYHNLDCRECFQGEI